MVQQAAILVAPEAEGAAAALASLVVVEPVARAVVVKAGLMPLEQTAPQIRVAARAGG